MTLRLIKANPLPDNMQEKIGVLLVNLGTPSGTDFFSMRRYFKQFLKDKRIVEWPKWMWYPILYAIILNLRPRRSGKLYKRIWDRERNESPLRIYTRAQSEKLATHYQNKNIIIDWAMRYGTPSIDAVTEKLLQQNCTHIILLPLYPQYSATTTASVYDNFFNVLKTKRFIPSISTISSYANNPVYIESLTNSIQDHLKKLDFKPRHIIASFHGIPQSYIQRGDPYLKECTKTYQALLKNLNLHSSEFTMTFQSRFGPETWLQPYTDMKVKELAQNNIESLAIFAPGFASDCLETIDEIKHEIAQTFYKYGGKKFTYIPCLNDSDNAINLYRNLIDQELKKL